MSGQKEKPRVLITDRLLDWTILRFFPDSVTPNRITSFRFVCVPIVIALLLDRNYAWGGIVFVVAAFSDALDGARARTRNQVTEWGKVADPFADKLLIGSVAVILVAHYVSVWIAVAMLGIDALIGGRALFLLSQGKSVEAKRAGKIKMLLQSTALIFLFIYIVWGIPVFLTLATYTLGAAIIFAALSLAAYSSI